MALLEPGIPHSKNLCDWTRDSALLRSGIREGVTLKLPDPGFLISEGAKIKINSTFTFGNDGNDRKST